MASQAGSQAVTSQAGALLPPGEGSNLAITQTGRQPGTLLPPREGSSLVATQAGSQTVTSQAGTLLPSGEGSILATTQAGRQALSFLLGNSLIFLAKLCPSLPIIWKLL